MITLSVRNAHEAVPPVLLNLLSSGIVDGHDRRFPQPLCIHLTHPSENVIQYDGFGVKKSWLHSALYRLHEADWNFSYNVDPRTGNVVIQQGGGNFHSLGASFAFYGMFAQLAAAQHGPKVGELRVIFGQFAMDTSEQMWNILLHCQDHNPYLSPRDGQPLDLFNDLDAFQSDLAQYCTEPEVIGYKTRFFRRVVAPVMADDLDGCLSWDWK